MHKFVELSQRIVVEKSVIQKYQNENKRSTLNRIHSTQEISSQCFNQVAVMTSSTSSSDVLEKLSSTMTAATSVAHNDNADVTDNDDNGDIGVIEPSSASLSPLTMSPDEEPAAAATALNSNGKIKTDAINESDDDTGDHDDDDVDDGDDNVDADANESANAESKNQMKKSSSASIVTTRTLTKSSLMSTSTTKMVQQKKIDLAKKTNIIKSNDNLIENSSSNYNLSKLQLPEMQRPLKPQSEMDFSVPYNIINNYFSVGVVSEIP